MPPMKPLLPMSPGARTLRGTFVAVFLLLGASSADAAPESYEIDATHSSVLFRIGHLGVSYTYGRFNAFSGSFVVDDETLSNARVALEIKAESVDTGNEKRDAHLRGADFFDIQSHPTITFKSRSVEKDGETYRVKGDLTLHGVTRDVVLRMQRIGEADDPWGNHRMGFDGAVVIKRSDFGMTNMREMIGDEVRITLGIEGIRAKKG